MRDLQKNYDKKFCILVETHTSSDKARSIIKRFDLNYSFIQEVQGHAGGTWCLWDQFVWRVNMPRHSNQLVHMEVQ